MGNYRRRGRAPGILSAIRIRNISIDSITGSGMFNVGETICVKNPISNTNANNYNSNNGTVSNAASKQI